MTETAFYRIDPQQEVVLISNKWHRLVDVQRALTGQGVLVLVERCEHGNIDAHEVWTLTDDWGWWKPCPGAGIGDTDART